MVIEKQEFLDESSKSVFLETPKFIDGFGSYYPEALEYEGEKYVIHQKPHKLFYPNIYIVKVVKFVSGLKYGDKKREYSSMIFNNGKLKPFIHGISINNWKEMNGKHPIIETEENGYMKYDENLNCSKLKGLPEGYYPSRWNIDKGTIQLNHIENDNSRNEICGIDENYIIKPINGVPEGMYIYDIKENIATLYHSDKENKEPQFYFYNEITKTISPFIFKDFENQSYKIEAYNADRNVINICTEKGEIVYFYFNGESEITEKVTLHINAKIAELNKNSETARLYSINKDSHREGFYFYKDGSIKEFSGLKEDEKIGYSETYQFINPKSLVKSIVILDKNRNEECRTFDQNGCIKSFKGLKEGWKAGNRIKQSSNGDFFFLPIKIKGFGDETHSLLSKNSQEIIFYKDMLITGINPKKRKLTIVTKEGPDCDIKIDDNERNTLMKKRDPNYMSENTINTSKELIENLQQ